MIKQFLTTAALALTFSATTYSQTAVDLLGKSVTDADVSKFVSENSLDPVTGIGYGKGVQLFQDKGLVIAIYLFNKGVLNGMDMAAYTGPMPFNISFTDVPESLKRKIAGTPLEESSHIVWDMTNYQVDVAFSDEKKTAITYIALEKK